MRTELLFQDVERAIEIFWPFVYDVVVAIGLDESAWRSPHQTTHVCDLEDLCEQSVQSTSRLLSCAYEESTTFGLWFGDDFICNGRQQGTIRLQESVRFQSATI